MSNLEKNSAYENFLATFLGDYAKTRNDKSRIKSSPEIVGEHYSASPKRFELIFDEQAFFKYFGFPLQEVVSIEHSLHNDDFLLINFLNSEKKIIYQWPVYVKEFIVAINQIWAEKEEQFQAKNKRLPWE
jgi:hypothetical protein